MNKAFEIIKIGLVQTYCTPEKDANTLRTIELIRSAAKKGAQIICLQELFNTRYFCWEEDYIFFELAEPADGTTIERLTSVCKELNIVLIVPYFEKRANGVFHNSAVVIDSDGTIIGNYRKQHIPDDPGYYEKFYFTPGDGGYKSFQTAFGKIGVLICWDQWYPEAARLTALKGADVIFYPTAIGWPVGQDSKLNKKEFDAWQTMQRSHAIANGLYVVAVNRIGTEKDNIFWGGSFVSDPFGEIIFQASHESEEIAVVEIDLKTNEHFRHRWPFFRDRRIDTYKPINKRFLE